MPTNFQESTVTGTKWSRCRTVMIGNPYQQAPRINLQEETLLVIDGLAPLSVGMRNLDAAFDPSAVINLRDPRTDELTGTTTTQGAVYAILYSLYRQMAGAQA